MALEYGNMPLAGDVIDDFAILFRELVTKVNTKQFWRFNFNSLRISPFNAIARYICILRW